MSKVLIVSCSILIGGMATALVGQTVPKKAEDAKPLAVGSMIPDAVVMNLDGSETTTLKIAKSQPTVFVFYRGGWCPYCNRHLAELRKAEQGLKEMGYQMVAITPDLPSELKKTLDKDELSYKLVSDSGAAAMKAFGVAFEVDQETVTMYKDRFKIDLEQSSGQKHHYLPVPSVFVSNGKAEIKFMHSNPDYRVRLSGDAVLAAAKAALVE